MSIEEIKLNNPGILSSSIPEEIFSQLKNIVQKQIDNKNINFKLKRSMMTDPYSCGIEESLWITLPESYENYLNEFSLSYIKYFDMEAPENYKTRVTHSWLNLQKQHEYRPLHKHFNGLGKNLSFVTYITIPYDTKEEDQHPNHFKAKSFRNGRIEFIYNKFTGEQTNLILDVNKTFEGKTIIFLDSLYHVVYPFYTSNDYRVSLSGNIEIY